MYVRVLLKDSFLYFVIDNTQYKIRSVGITEFYTTDLIILSISLYRYRFEYLGFIFLYVLVQ